MNVFSFLKDKKQLDECCLVCQHWASYVEDSMYRHIRLDNWKHQQRIKFVEHLNESPYLCQQTQSATNEQHSVSRSAFQDFLELALTSNIRTSRGYWSPVDLEVAIDVISNPDFAKLDRLEQLPCTIKFGETYMRLLQLCKESLKPISFTIRSNTNQHDMASMVNSMDQFKKLTRMIIIDIGEI